MSPVSYIYQVDVHTLFNAQSQHILLLILKKIVNAESIEDLYDCWRFKKAISDNSKIFLYNCFSILQFIFSVICEISLTKNTSLLHATIPTIVIFDTEQNNTDGSTTRTLAMGQYRYPVYSLIWCDKDDESGHEYIANTTLQVSSLPST